MATKKKATTKKAPVQKKQRKQIDWKNNDWKKRIETDTDGKEKAKIWNEIRKEYGDGFVFKSGKTLTEDWFEQAYNHIQRKANKGKAPVRAPKPTTSSSKRVVPKTAKDAPKPVQGDLEFGSLALDRDNCYKHGTVTYTHDDIIKEKAKDGWRPVYIYREGMSNVIFFQRSVDESHLPPLHSFPEEKEPHIAAKELMDSVIGGVSVKSSVENVVDHLLNEKDVPNVDRSSLGEGVLRVTHKILIELIQQGQIRTLNNSNG